MDILHLDIGEDIGEEKHMTLVKSNIQHPMFLTTTFDI